MLKMDTATARLKLKHKPRKDGSAPDLYRPFTGPIVSRGLSILYRRNIIGAGCWIARGVNPRGTLSAKGKPAPYWTEVIGFADDCEPAVNDYAEAIARNVFKMDQAMERAREMARERSASGGKAHKTVAEALDEYEAELRVNGADTGNARRVRLHMTDELLKKNVTDLEDDDLRNWRNGLTHTDGKNKGQPVCPDTANRTATPLRAALNFAADRDRRITNREVFRVALKRIGGEHANKSREGVYIEDIKLVMRIVDEAHNLSQRFGLLIEVLAQTGARISQVARIDCGDLKGNRLMVPPSRKGGRNRSKQAAIEWIIQPALAMALNNLKGGRADSEPLLLNDKGDRWLTHSDNEQWRSFNAVVEVLKSEIIAAGLDPKKITTYALRHTSICRMLEIEPNLLRVAQMHNTSVLKIQTNYAKYIHRHGDATRYMLPARGNVVTLPTAARSR